MSQPQALTSGGHRGQVLPFACQCFRGKSSTSHGQRDRGQVLLLPHSPLCFDHESCLSPPALSLQNHMTFT